MKKQSEIYHQTRKNSLLTIENLPLEQLDKISASGFIYYANFYELKRLLQTFVLFAAFFSISFNSYSAVITVTNTNDFGTGSLRTAIVSLAVNGDTIRFDPNLISNGSDTIIATEIRFSKSLYIIGLYNTTDTLYISGNNNSRIFGITNTTNVTLDSLVLINGNGVGTTLTGHGGAVLYRGSDTLSIKNSIIRGNVAGSKGGGIYVYSFDYSNSPSIRVINSIISGNTTINGNGGGIYTSSSSSPTSSSVTVNNSTISGNAGAGIYSYFNNSSFPPSFSSIMVNNSTINGNTGAGIYSFSYSNDTVIVNNSIINGNTGRGIYSYSSNSSFISISNSEISENIETGVYSYSYSSNYTSTVLVDSSDIIGNERGIFSYSDGSSSLVTVSNSNISGNTTSNSGGGIYANSNLTSSSLASVTVNNSTICGNIAYWSGGGIYCSANSTFVTVNNATISGNTANNGAGGIFSRRNPTTVINSTISGNVAVNGDGGGISSDSVIVINSTINSNVAPNGNGGGIYSFSGAFPSIEVIHSTMKWNNAGSDGGGIYASTSLSPGYFPSIVVDNSDISENTSGDQGGGIYCLSGTGTPNSLTVTNSILNGNISGTQGGGILSRNVIVSNSTISNNASMSSYGGGVVGGYVSVTNSTISNNTAATDGGGIHDAFSTSSSYSFITISNSTISGNVAGDDGGGISTYSQSSNATITVTHSTINGNISTNGNGGGISSTTTPITVINSTISGNDAANGLGGGIWLNNSNSFVGSSIIALNGNNNIYTGLTSITSQGYNVFSNAPVGTISTDQINVTGAQLNLQPLAYYGGTTQTMSPGVASVAINMGNPTDSTDAQNRSITGIRDVGAAEYCAQTTYSTINSTACNNYISPSGFYTWVSSGTYTDIIPNSVGCDSIITVVLTVDSTSATINPISCGSYTSPSGNYIWSCSGTYMDTISNSVGCDSIFTVNLIIANTSSSTINPITCYSYTSPSGNYIWTNTGTYMDTIPNAMGCDSVITINLTIDTTSSASTISPTVCDSYTSPSGNYTWISSGTYTDTIPNAIGCDSVITINLTITVVDVTTSLNANTITANQLGATYQWVDCSGMTPIIGATNQSYTATANGDYAVIVTINGCSDTSVCSTVTGVGIMENGFGKEILLFPNPTDGNFSIDLGENYQSVIVTVTDLSGKLILSNTYEDSQLLNLNIDEIAGVYLLIIESGSKKKIIRLVKE